MVPHVIEVNSYFWFWSQLLFDIWPDWLLHDGADNDSTRTLSRLNQTKSEKILSRLVVKTFYLQVGLTKIKVSTI